MDYTSSIPTHQEREGVRLWRGCPLSPSSIIFSLFPTDSATGWLILKTEILSSPRGTCRIPRVELKSLVEWEYHVEESFWFWSFPAYDFTIEIPSSGVRSESKCSLCYHGSLGWFCTSGPQALQTHWSEACPRGRSYFQSLILDKMSPGTSDFTSPNLYSA